MCMDAGTRSGTRRLYASLTRVTAALYFSSPSGLANSNPGGFSHALYRWSRFSSPVFSAHFLSLSAMLVHPHALFGEGYCVHRILAVGLGTREPADGLVHLTSTDDHVQVVGQSGLSHLVDGGLHGVERQREEPRQRQNLRPMLAHGLHERLFGHVDAQIDDFEAVDVQDETHDV